MVAAGASGTNTGRSDCSLTASMTWGFQNRAVAYQLPSFVSGSAAMGATGCLIRSRSFLVRCSVYMSEADASGDGVLVHVGAEDGGLLVA